MMKKNRRLFLQTISTIPALFSVKPSLAFNGDNNQPNILWIIAEDISPDIGCYGNPLVHTPNMDQLAREGVRFTNTFTTAPVCSAARSALMTGMYQTTIGAHNHRSHRNDGYTLPEGVNVITEYFKEAGYYTANITKFSKQLQGTGKTDWNFNAKQPFEGNDWEALKSNQPFFAQINFPETHRTFERDQEHPIDPSQVDIPPYYPDHPITRRDWADYLETVNVLDKKVGAVLQRLVADGLAENTIVVFMGDHGRCHVRGKQWLYDGGIHIPFIIRWPDHLKAGTVNDDLIASIDITAATLAMAGITPPSKMQGQNFLSEDTEKREYIISARDRCDETVDRIRCVRTNELKYIRNYYPERPYAQLNRYKERQYPVLRLMRKLHHEGKLTPAQELFMAATRPQEELYDLVNDPHEVNNLANDEVYKETLMKMRSQLDDWIKLTDDQGGTEEDPSIAKDFEERMRKTYDKDIRELYEKEGMDLAWIGM